MRCLATTVLVATVIVASRATFAATVDPKVAKDLYDRVTPSLVVVQYTYDGELGRRELNAAGVVVSDDGLVMVSESITPAALPDEQMKEFKIIIPGDDETELAADFQGRDERTGLSFIKAKEQRTWTPLKFTDAPIEIGDTVCSLGVLPKDAGYKTYFMAATVASRLRGPVPQVMVSGEGLAAVGSPIFNLQGQAIGIVHAQQEQSPVLNDPRQPMGAVMSPARFFVPASDFLISLNEPPVAGSPLKLPALGIRQLAGLKKDVAEYFGLKGQAVVQVGDVIPGFPAAKAGLKSGDIIVKVNDQPLERGDDPDEAPAIMTRKMLRMKVGDPVKLTVLRGDKDQPLKDIVVTLEERPQQANRAKRYFAEDLGFTARELVFDDTYNRKLAADTKGVLVALIKPNSSAQTAKLQNGDLVTKINQTPVENLDQFKQQYQAFRKDKPHEAVVLEVLRGAYTQVVRIEPPQ